MHSGKDKIVNNERITADEIYRAQQIMAERNWRYEWRGSNIMYAIIDVNSNGIIDMFIPTREEVYRYINEVNYV